MVRKLPSTELLPAEEKTKPYGFLSSVDRRVALQSCESRHVFRREQYS